MRIRKSLNTNHVKQVSEHLLSDLSLIWCFKCLPLLMSSLVPSFLLRTYVFAMTLIVDALSLELKLNDFQLPYH